MTRLTLEKISQDLFDAYETEIKFQVEIPRKQDLNERAEQYFRKINQQSEIAGENINLNEMNNLTTAFKHEVLPAYQTYREKKETIIENGEKRNIWKYVIGTIVVSEVLEAVLTRGQSMRPGIFIPTAFVEGGLGTAMYSLAKINDKRKIKKAKKQFHKTVSSIEERLTFEIRHDNFQEIMDGDIIEAEAFSLLSKYNKPEDFWNDYRRVREIDPTNIHAFGAIKEVSRFEDFVELHTKGILSNEKREMRFNQLFLKGHEYFTSKEPQNYVLNNLRGKIK